MDRREFLKRSAGTILVLPFGTFLVMCKEDAETGSNATEADPSPPDASPRSMGSNIIFTSSKDNGHAHSFTVPRAGIETPPVGGVVGYTTPVQGHSHALDVSQEALRRVAEGQIAKVVASKEMEHTHTFTIVKVG
jgi:hypothetical protein